MNNGLAAMDLNSDGTPERRTTIDDAYAALEAHFRLGGDKQAIAEAFANEDEPNPARDMSARELADFVGESYAQLQDRYDNDGTLL